MILPTQDQCRAAIQELLECEGDLTEWECGFVNSNEHRTEFSDRQREMIARFGEKYDLKALA